ncbi:alanine racemase [Novosphingobium ginsenosidimutans]|uniref:alanine racemase n=1 Tax=Novosphingobium ginsenosidimutans TaxID=1176536 RepID=A0A5B8S9U8_9SPHN|nr:alanine racemase [Novosphingobium ginsenosidimutans]QEA17085.1 alanine racemase [Novosphingobium ginsenosidimutans]
MLPELPPATLRLAIDRDALAANWRALDRLSGQASAGAAVKADAYGLGVAVAAPVLREAGCRDFFVAHWQEVPALLEHVPPAAVAVLHGPLTAADAAFAKTCGVRPVINSLLQAQRWIEAGGGPCDLMIDTGINRIGLSLGDLPDPVIAQLEIDVLHSHLASADEDSAQNAAQQSRWNAARGVLQHKRASLANSAGITLGPDYHGNLTRPGLALYGGVPCAALAGEISQVVAPEAALLQVRNIAAGESVGYNATFVAPRAMRIGVISLGYADGYLRAWSGKGMLRSMGRSVSVIGRVSMDMTVVDLTATPDLREGDWLRVDYSLPEASSATGLSQYELLTLLGRRFAR